MKRTFVAAFASLAMVMLVGGYAIAAPGQGQGKGPGGDVPEKAVAAQDQCAGQGEVFGQGQDGVEGKTGCGCHQGCACANAEEGNGCQGGCGMAGEGKGCGCAMAGEGKGCQGGCAMAAEGKGCGCGMGMGMGHGKGHHKGDHRFWKCPKARTELNLTEEQTKKLEELETADQGKIDVLQREMKDLKDRKHELMKAQPIDVNLVSEVVTKLGATKTELMLIRTGMKAAALNVLTPEQRDKLSGLHEKMMAGKPGCMGRDKDDDDDDLDDDLDKITCPKAMEERAAKLEKKAKEHDKEARELKAKARELKAKAKKAKGGKGKGKNR